MKKIEFEEKVLEIKNVLNEQCETLLKSELVVERYFKLNPNSTDKEIFEWYSNIRKENSLKVEQVDLKNCDDWITTNQIIKHKSNKFFEIIGLKIHNSHSREVGQKGWFQPIIKEVGYDGGTLGLLRKKISGIPHYLINAKAEPGNYNGIQLSPTLQATKSNLEAAHGGSKPLFLDYFLNTKSDYVVIFDQWLPEDGGRLFLKRNRGIVLGVSENTKIELPKDFKWVTLNQIIKFIQEENMVNPHLRSLISIL